MPSLSALLRHASKPGRAAPEPSRDLRNQRPVVLSFRVSPELLILGNLSRQSMRRPAEGLPLAVHRSHSAGERPRSAQMLYPVPLGTASAHGQLAEQCVGIRS